MYLISVTKEARVCNGENSVSLINSFRKIGQPHETGSNWTMFSCRTQKLARNRLNTTCKTWNQKAPGSSTGTTSLTLVLAIFGRVCLPRQEKQQQKLRLRQTLWSFYVLKKTITNVKRQPTVQEKTLANDIFSKGLVSKINKELKEINIKNANSPSWKCTEELNRHFSKEDCG